MKKYNERDEAVEDLQDDQITVYIDTGGWGYYKCIDRADATANVIIVYDRYYSDIDQEARIKNLTAKIDLP